MKIDPNINLIQQICKSILFEPEKDSLARRLDKIHQATIYLARKLDNDRLKIKKLARCNKRMYEKWVMPYTKEPWLNKELPEAANE